MKDWKETIRELLSKEINYHEQMVAYANFPDYHVSSLASLRNALEQFEKAVKEEWKPDKLQCNCKKYFANEIELYEHMKNCYT